MKKITAQTTFEFKGMNLQTGDHISFIAPLLNLPKGVQIDACVTHSENNGIHVFSTQLAPFKHNGFFTEGDIEELCIESKAPTAFSKQARNEVLYHGQRAFTDINKERFEGELIGAFDGIVVMWSDQCKYFITGGSRNFQAVFQ